MGYREMETTEPPTPRREWALARYLRSGTGAQLVTFWVCFAVWLMLFALSDYFVPVERNDPPPGRDPGARGIRSHGVWSSGQIGDKHAEWCFWGGR